MTDRVELLLQSPTAVSLLGLLELQQREGSSPYDMPTDVRPDAIAKAIDRLTSTSVPELLERLANFPDVYCCGEFSWRARWTVTSPHPRLHNELVWAWEMDDDHPDPVLRWHSTSAGLGC